MAIGSPFHRFLIAAADVSQAFRSNIGTQKGAAHVSHPWIGQLESKPDFGRQRVRHKVDIRKGGRPAYLVELAGPSNFILVPPKHARSWVRVARLAMPIVALVSMFLVIVGTTVLSVHWVASYQQQQTAERYASAIDQLDSLNVSVRVDALYVLAHIAQDSISFKDSGSRLDTIQAVIDAFIQAHDRSDSLVERWVPGADLVVAVRVLGEVDTYAGKVTWVAADFHGADLRDVDLNGSNLNGSNLFGSNLSHTSLDNATLHAADLRNSDLSRASLRGVNLANAILAKSSLRGVNLANATLTRADLRDVDLTSATLTRADLRGVDLAGATLTNADLQGADLRGVDLRDAHLQNTDLRGADLRNAELPLTMRKSTLEISPPKIWEDSGAILDPYTKF
ncbi:pentapeptide repeat-containing protein [Streptosporangiaceae bacterium NEAU-GS5]|nr:pentapeptide repeat-containing protein [Streptosporangiaceae bacterium NEAU-GS5]